MKSENPPPCPLCALNGRGVSTAEGCKAYFSPRHVCDALGITWTGQRVKIMDDDVLKSVVKEIFTTGRDGKTYKMSMLPVESANRSRYLYGYH